ncbi:MAG: GIY-YIG nuclease family protein [Slackia sp.]|nr:GIY-YIG nuclease family protein [Slackia sp.]
MTVVVPRDLLSQAKKLPDIPKRGVYYLLDDNKGRLRRVYAGQTVQGISRLDDHFVKKNWWNTAVMFLGPDSEFSLDVVSGLEERMIGYIANHGSYVAENSVIPKPFVSPYTEAFIAGLHEDILFRMGVLGFDLDAVGEDVSDDGGVFHTPRRGIDAFGRYDSGAGRFVVLAGSQVDMDCRCGTKDRPVKRLEDLRSMLKNDGSIAEDAAGAWRVNCDVEFSTPSAAAVFVLGGSQNGWTEWVSDAGETLSAVYRGK